MMAIEWLPTAGELPVVAALIYRRSIALGSCRVAPVPGAPGGIACLYRHIRRGRSAAPRPHPRASSSKPSGDWQRPARRNRSPSSCSSRDTQSGTNARGDCAPSGNNSSTILLAHCRDWINDTLPSFSGGPLAQESTISSFGRLGDRHMSSTSSSKYCTRFTASSSIARSFTPS